MRTREAARWLDLVVPRAQLIVALDHPRWFSLQRLVRRTVVRAIGKMPICNGNTQSWRGLYAQDAIERWHFERFARKRDRMRTWAAHRTASGVLLINRPRDLEACMPRFRAVPNGPEKRAPGRTACGDNGCTDRIMVEMVAVTD